MPEHPGSSSSQGQAAARASTAARSRPMLDVDHPLNPELVDERAILVEPDRSDHLARPPRPERCDRLVSVVAPNSRPRPRELLGDAPRQVPARR